MLLSATQGFYPAGPTIDKNGDAADKIRFIAQIALNRTKTCTFGDDKCLHSKRWENLSAAEKKSFKDSLGIYLKQDLEKGHETPLMKAFTGYKLVYTRGQFCIKLGETSCDPGHYDRIAGSLWNTAVYKYNKSAPVAPTRRAPGVTTGGSLPANSTGGYMRSGGDMRVIAPVISGVVRGQTAPAGAALVLNDRNKKVIGEEILSFARSLGGRGAAANLEEAVAYLKGVKKIQSWDDLKPAQKDALMKRFNVHRGDLGTLRPQFNGSGKAEQLAHAGKLFTAVFAPESVVVTPPARPADPVPPVRPKDGDVPPIRPKDGAEPAMTLTDAEKQAVRDAASAALAKMAMRGTAVKADGTKFKMSDVNPANTAKFFKDTPYSQMSPDLKAELKAKLGNGMSGKVVDDNTTPQMLQSTFGTGPGSGAQPVTPPAGTPPAGGADPAGGGDDSGDKKDEAFPFWVKGKGVKGDPKYRFLDFRWSPQVGIHYVGTDQPYDASAKRPTGPQLYNIAPISFSLQGAFKKIAKRTSIGARVNFSMADLKAINTSEHTDSSVKGGKYWNVSFGPAFFIGLGGGFAVGIDAAVVINQDMHTDFGKGGANLTKTSGGLRVGVEVAHRNLWHLGGNYYLGTVVGLGGYVSGTIGGQFMGDAIGLQVRPYSLEAFLGLSAGISFGF